MDLPNMWWIVANNGDPDHGWHWDRYFARPGDRTQNFNWGGPNWIKSRTSIARVREMRQGDLVAAYQASEGIVGLTRLGSDGRMSPETHKFDTFDLASSPTVRLHSPVPLDVIKNQPDARDAFEFVRIVKQGSVFRVSSSGRDRILSLARQFNASQASQIDAIAESDAS